MSKMKTLIMLVLLFGLSTPALALYHSNLTVNRIMTNSDGSVHVEFNEQPPNTCSYYGVTVKLDGTSRAGKNILATLLMLKVNQSKLSIWYEESSAKGNTQSSGCNHTTLSTLKSVRMD
jgi:hypothetical protein